MSVSTAGAVTPRKNYLNISYAVWSWLLTRDHKRIGILYMISITAFFLLGGLAATLIRLELLTPQGDVMSAETYNRMFTLHGVVMIFLFLIPSIPAVLGNFLLPLMLGARDLAPLYHRQSVRWYGAVAGRRRHRMDLLHTLQLADRIERGSDYFWRLHCRVLVDSHRAQLYRHHPHDARARAHLVPAAAVRLVDVRDQHHPGAGNPGAGDHAAAGGVRAIVRDRHLRPETGRRSGAVPAYVLVLLPPGGLYHDLARHGSDQRDRRLLLAEPAVRLQVHRFRQPGDRIHRLSGLGASYVRRRRVGLFGHDILGAKLSGRHPLGDQGLQLDGHDVQGLDLVQDPDDLCAGVYRPVRDRRADRPIPGGAAGRCACDRHLFRGRPLSLHHGRRRCLGLPGRDSLLVAEDNRADVF